MFSYFLCKSQQCPGFIYSAVTLKCNSINFHGILPPPKSKKNYTGKERGKMVKWSQINVDSDQILKPGLEAKKSISQTKLPPYSASQILGQKIYILPVPSKPKFCPLVCFKRHFKTGKVVSTNNILTNNICKSDLFSAHK